MESNTRLAYVLSVSATCNFDGRSGEAGLNDALVGPRTRSLFEAKHCMTQVGPAFGTFRARPARRLRIGVLASEFPPHHGGMQEHARGLVQGLAREHEVSVYTSPGQGCDDMARTVSMHPVMRWKLSHDLPGLQAAPVDAWITLNAGLASYSRSLRAPVFAYVHGNDFIRPWLPHPERPVRLARRLCGDGAVRRWRTRQIGAGLLAARWVFANSAFSRDLCVSIYGLRRDRVTVVPPGMRSEFFDAGTAHPGDRLRLVTVSRLAANAERKNIDGVLQAIASLGSEIDIAYTVIGDGDDLPRLRDLAQALGLASRVRFLGGVGTQTVIEEFGRSDVFVMAVKPSEADVEGFGMVYAEAAATGLPSIGTNTGGIPEVIEDGVTGLLLDDVSPGGIADGLRRFARRRGDFDRCSIRAKAERFSAACCTRMIAERIVALI